MPAQLASCLGVNSAADEAQRSWAGDVAPCGAAVLMQSKLGQRDLKRPRRAARSAYGPAALLARAMNRAAYQSALPDGILVTPPPPARRSPGPLPPSHSCGRRSAGRPKRAAALQRTARRGGRGRAERCPERRSAAGGARGRAGSARLRAGARARRADSARARPQVSGPTRRALGGARRCAFLGRASAAPGAPGVPAYLYLGGAPAGRPAPGAAPAARGRAAQAAGGAGGAAPGAPGARAGWVADPGRALELPEPARPRAEGAWPGAPRAARAAPCEECGGSTDEERSVCAAAGPPSAYPPLGAALGAGARAAGAAATGLTGRRPCGCMHVWTIWFT